MAQSPVSATFLHLILHDPKSNLPKEKKKMNEMIPKSQLDLSMLLLNYYRKKCKCSVEKRVQTLHNVCAFGLFVY